MKDEKLLSLWLARDETAIPQTDLTYGKLCMHIAKRILKNYEDAEECVNDAYLAAWNAIPPLRPDSLSAYLAKIVRNLAVSRYRKKHAKKRQPDLEILPLEELADVVGDGRDTAGEYVEKELLKETVNCFLEAQKKRDRQIFLRRYFFLDTVKEISECTGIGEGNIRVILHRMRKELKAGLEKEGLL